MVIKFPGKKTKWAVEKSEVSVPTEIPLLD
jgi:hypothetical protein